MTLQEIFDNWETVLIEVKKDLAKKRKAAIKKYQGAIQLAQGFSFDSDSNVKLYKINAWHKRLS